MSKKAQILPFVKPGPKKEAVTDKTDSPTDEADDFLNDCSECKEEVCTGCNSFLD